MGAENPLCVFSMQMPRSLTTSWSIEAFFAPVDTISFNRGSRSKMVRGSGVRWGENCALIRFRALKRFSCRDLPGSRKSLAAFHRPWNALGTL